MLLRFLFYSTSSSSCATAVVVHVAAATSTSAAVSYEYEVRYPARCLLQLSLATLVYSVHGTNKTKNPYSLIQIWHLVSHGHHGIMIMPETPTWYTRTYQVCCVLQFCRGSAIN